MTSRRIMNLTSLDTMGEPPTAQEASLLALIITTSVIGAGQWRHPPPSGFYPSGMSSRLRHLFASDSIGFWSHGRIFTLRRRRGSFSITLGIEGDLTLEETGLERRFSFPWPMRNADRVFAGIKGDYSPIGAAPARSGISTSLSSVTASDPDRGSKKRSRGRDLPLSWGFQPDLLSKKAGEPQAQERQHRRLLQAVG